ncbi:MAG TPA: neutral zinc metallopeptidase [Thermomicrobiales bacterium]|nr:neutral zinc metallopeptidase [Thermomicrobiales bacterium]
MASATNWARFRALMVLLVAVLLVPLPAPVHGAQDDRTDSVTAAAIELSRLERSGDLLTLHDRLHPDVRMVVSRAALAAWYAGPDVVIPTDDPEILSVEFGSWTWPVTERAYADVATVVLRQQGTKQGAVVEQIELQHFLFDGVRWRWFFGADMPFIEALEAQTTPDAGPSVLGDIAYARVDLVWSEIYSQADIPYGSPDSINPIPELPVGTGCGQMTIDEYAEVFYCNLDQEIYYLIGFQEQMARQFGTYAWPHIIAHEWGHHIQFLEGIRSTDAPELDDGVYVIEQELQADCLAGVFAQEAVARGWLTMEDLNDAYQVSIFAGDLPGTTFDDPVAHGSAEQRQQAFTMGLEDGLVGCNLDLVSD